MGYVELHARSAFSFLEGASAPETLAEVCSERSIPAVALLDRDGVYGSPRMHLAAKKLGLKAHVGAEVSVEDVLFGEAERCRYPLLVESRTGYQNLCRLITKYKLRERRKGDGATTQAEFEEHAEGLVCLTGGVEGPLAEALMRGGYDEGLRTVECLKQTFGARNVYVELQRHRNREQESRNKAAVSIAHALHLPLLATNGVCYATPKEREIQDVFTSIHLHTTLEGAGTRLQGNAERHLRSGEEMARLFADLPEAIENTVSLSSRLQFELSDLGYEFPKFPVPNGETMSSFLRERAREGWTRRYRHCRDHSLCERSRRQMTRELDLIEKLDLAGYFLIVWDVVRFCGEQKILVQGRGSAANSVVCYVLGITTIDPVRMDLLFERFLSEERNEWPDIDIDLPSGDQREKVIQYVYAKYGQHGAAMTANVNTYRGKSASREVGKVLGFNEVTLSHISKVTSSFEWKGPGDTMEAKFRQSGLNLQDSKIHKYLDLSLRILDLPRHLSQHSGGMIICQGLLSSVVPLEPATMPGRVVVQWDKEDCADLGLIKMDFLGLGMMAVLEECYELVPRHYGVEIDYALLSKDDPAVYAAIQQADTVGMFQIESRAQMASLPRTRPICFYDLVKQVAIIRPGPIIGEMVNPYIERRLGRAPITYPHPLLEPILRRTLGVPLFQEQILKIAMVIADFTGGEAEELRRAMGFKRSVEKVHAMEARLRSGMSAKQIDSHVQDQIIKMIEAVGHYTFPESHAAEFAEIAYISAYLKCHYPEAFTAALLNQWPMGFYPPDTIVRDAKRHGVKVCSIDINRSDWKCTVEHMTDQTDLAVRVGLRFVRGLRESVGRSIFEERVSNGPFTSVEDLSHRVPDLREDELVTLAEIGALNRMYSPDRNAHRRIALWDAARAAQDPGPLFRKLNDESVETPLKKMTTEERLVADYHGTGFTVGPHPLFYSRSELDGRDVVPVSKLTFVPNGARVRTAGSVLVRQRPGTASGLIFMSLEDETGISNAVIMHDVFERYRLLILGSSFLLIEGRMQNVDGVRTIRAEMIEELNLTAVETTSHNFH